MSRESMRKPEIHSVATFSIVIPGNDGDCSGCVFSFVLQVDGNGWVRCFFLPLSSFKKKLFHGIMFSSLPY